MQSKVFTASTSRSVVQRVKRNVNLIPCSVPRRSMAAAIVTAPMWLMLTLDAEARDYKEARREAEERKMRLRETADADRKTGQDRQAFEDSNYMVGEDARTPNVHARQSDSAKFERNV